LLWISLNEELGWLTLTSDLSQAAAFVLGGDLVGQSWQVHTPHGLADVVYSVGNPSPLLTINGDGLSKFAVTTITPSLDAIRSVGDASRGDFRSVSLAGQSLAGIKLGQADFTGGDLTGTVFTRATLTQAIFRQATLAGAIFDQALVDQADFTQASLA